jgi:hypothetical protein
MLERGQYHACTFRKISTPLRREHLHATSYDIYIYLSVLFKPTTLSARRVES